jgi:Fe2+ transport system protein FeoA
MSSETNEKLTAAREGASVEIVSIGGGVRLHSRLAGMGLQAGTRVEIRRNDGWGPLLIAQGHARIAIGRGMAEHVRVCPAGTTVASSRKARMAV